MTAYYNEFDPYCAQWLRNLIDAGHIPFGDVDERSITEIDPDEIKEYNQWHFFAGLGGWGYAARLAGLPDNAPILTGSPPCQPFSAAGQQRGYADDRHLAPHWLRLVAALRPAFVFGEQVAAAINKDNWLDDLLNELEAQGYATGSVVLPACGVGAPHIRQRIWVVGRLANAADNGHLATQNRGSVSEKQKEGRVQQSERACSHGGMAEPNCTRSQPRRKTSKTLRQGHSAEPKSGSDQTRPACPHKTGWGDPDWLYCRDGKWRPVESGTFPLDDGVPARVGRLRAYGNAIVPQVAAEIIKETIIIDS